MSLARPHRRPGINSYFRDDEKPLDDIYVAVLGSPVEGSRPFLRLAWWSLRSVVVTSYVDSSHSTCTRGEEPALLLRRAHSG